MSKVSRLVRPSSSAGPASKLPSPRKDGPGPGAAGARLRTISVGEKLMKAGSDGGPSRTKAAALNAPDRTVSQRHNVKISLPKASVPPKTTIQSKVSVPHGAVQRQARSNLKVTSPEDAEHLSRSRQAAPNGTPPAGGDPKASRTVPRRHTLGGARTAQDILAMQPPEMDKKREAFLEHLKQKYPHHASAIMGHQERLREQVSDWSSRDCPQEQSH